MAPIAQGEIGLMSDSMVERVAKTLIKRGGIDGGADFLARIAIEAMREPTPEMLNAMMWNVTRGRGPNHLDEWHAAIDEALK